jgi:hypothetical protein
VTAIALQPIRERARAHQAEINAAVVFFTPQELAVRWHCSVSTIRDIPREDLPYIVFGRGTKLKRRRYHPDHVRAYDRLREGGE